MLSGKISKLSSKKSWESKQQVIRLACSLKITNYICYSFFTGRNWNFWTEIHPLCESTWLLMQLTGDGGCGALAKNWPHFRNHHLWQPWGSHLSSMMMLCPLANHTLLALFGAEVNSFLSCPQNDEWQYHWFRLLKTNKVKHICWFFF